MHYCIILNKKDYLILILLFLLGILTRLLLLPKMMTHWDAAEYTIAIFRYTLIQDTPSVPGYPLYIAVGKAFHLFFKDPYFSILLVSVFFSAVGAIVYYIIGKRFFNRSVGIIAAFLLLSGPTFFYFGITANPYGILPTTAGILALIVYEMQYKNKAKGILLGLVYAFSIGIRPQDAFFLTPLFIFGLYLSDKKNRVFALFSCLIGTLSWLIPLLLQAGGLFNYLNLLNKYSETALPGISFIHFFSVWFIQVKGLFLSFGIANLFLVYYIPITIRFFRGKNMFKQLAENKLIVIFILWIIPSLVFNSFVRSDSAAHQMTYLSGILMLISFAIWSSFKNKNSLLWIILSLLVLFNLFTFFRDRDPGDKKEYITQSFHYSEIRKNDIRMSAKVALIKQKFNPHSTLLISTETLWRPYTYYLKMYPMTVLFGLNNINASYLYLHYRIDSINWNMNWYQTKYFSFKVPKGISTILFLDDESASWIKRYQVNVYHLPANSEISEVTVLPGSVIKYNYHSILITK